jgi:RNA polymerase sigma factor (TIGR02999 family)
LTNDPEPERNATQLLLAHTLGDPRGAAELLPLVYEELKALAAKRLSGERVNHTLQATALVHEAFLRLVDQDKVGFNGRTHFFAIAADTIRRVLIDHARARRTKKRAGRSHEVAWPADLEAPAGEVDLLALDETLQKLEGLDSRAARVVHLRFFGGMTVAEIAQVLKISTMTVKNDWRVARAWLKRWMREDS